MAYRYDVFISYCDADEEWVQHELAPRLEAASVHVGDRFAFAPGHPKLDEIERAVRDSRFVLLVLTPAYLNDAWRQFESILAASYGLDLGEWRAIPVLLAPCELPPRLRALVPVDLRDPINSAREWERLLHTIAPLPPLTEDAPERPANPFNDRGCIRDPARFFDRERIRRELYQALRAGNSISLVGEPQVGKSSLLRNLEQTQEKWFPGGKVLYLDAQGLLDEDDFCVEVLGGLGQPGGDLRALRRALRGQRVVLMVDEIEKLTSPGFTRGLQDVLRTLAQERDGPSLVVASQRPLTAIFPPSGPTSPLHNIFIERRLGGFDLYTCRAFLRARLAGVGVVFTDEEIEHLVGASGGNPGRLQRLAYDLFERKVG